MLVLSRKLNESIQIGENITITLIRVEGGKVRLGIDAPRDVRVLRSELEAHQADAKTLIGENDEDLESMRQENEAAQVSEREEAFAHPVQISSCREPINRLSHLSAPRISMERVKMSKAGAPLAAFLQ